MALAARLIECIFSVVFSRRVSLVLFGLAWNGHHLIPFSSIAEVKMLNTQAEHSIFLLRVRILRLGSGEVNLVDESYDETMTTWM